MVESLLEEGADRVGRYGYILHVICPHEHGRLTNDIVTCQITFISYHKQEVFDFARNEYPAKSRIVDIVFLIFQSSKVTNGYLIAQLSLRISPGHVYPLILTYCFRPYNCTNDSS
jgi:hypothetical protein